MKQFTNKYLGLVSMGQHAHTTMLNNYRQGCIYHIGQYRTLTPSTLLITPFSSSLSYIQLHITPTHSLSIFHVSAYCSILFSYISFFLFLCMVCIAGFNCGQKSQVKFVDQTLCIQQLSNLTQDVYIFNNFDFICT